MLKNLWDLVKDTAIYGSGRALLYPLSIITLPVFTRIFSPSDYGIIELIGVTVGLLSLLIDLSLSTSVMRYYYDSTSPAHKKEIVSTGFWLLLVWDILFISVLIIFSKGISLLVLEDSKYSILLTVAMITLAVSTLFTYCQGIIRLHFSPWKFSITALVNGLLSIGLSILLVVVFDLGLFGYFLGSAVAISISFITTVLFMKSDLAPIFSISKLKQMLSFSLPLIPASFAYYLLFSSNRYFLNFLGSTSDVGIYSIAIKITSVMLFFHAAFSLAWAPLVFKIYAESQENLKNLMTKVSKYLLLFFSFLAIAISVYSTEILKLLTTPEYYDASIAITPLSLGLVAYASTNVTALGMSLSRRTGFISLSAWIAAIINIGLNFLLIPSLGIFGTALASALSLIALTFLFGIISQKLFPLKYEKIALLKISILLLVFLAAGYFIRIPGTLNTALIKLPFLLLFVICLFLFKVFDVTEMEFFKQSIKKILKRA